MSATTATTEQSNIFQCLGMAKPQRHPHLEASAKKPATHLSDYILLSQTTINVKTFYFGPGAQ